MRNITTILTLMLVFLLAACSPSETSPEEEIPATETLEGAVEITFPQSGSIIYAESLRLEGTATNVPEEGFQIQLISPELEVIAEATIQPENGTWFTEIVHGFTGDPTEITIIAKNTNPDSILDYDIEIIVLSNVENRPDGVFGSILSPTEGITVGGDSILISGRGSGFFENTFVLRLENTEGEIITEMPVTINNPNFIDDMVWEAEIVRNDFIGNGTIRMVYQDAESGETIEVDFVNVVVSSVAG